MSILQIAAKGPESPAQTCCALRTTYELLNANCRVDAREPQILHKQGTGAACSHAVLTIKSRHTAVEGDGIAQKPSGAGSHFPSLRHLTVLAAGAHLRDGLAQQSDCLGARASAVNRATFFFLCARHADRHRMAADHKDQGRIGSGAW